MTRVHERDVGPRQGVWVVFADCVFLRVFRCVHYACGNTWKGAGSVTCIRFRGVLRVFGIGIGATVTNRGDRTGLTEQRDGVARIGGASHHEGVSAPLR